MKQGSRALGNSRGVALTEYLLLLLFTLVIGTLAIRNLQSTSNTAFGSVTAQLNDNTIVLDIQGGGSGSTTPSVQECAGRCVRNHSESDLEGL